MYIQPDSTIWLIKDIPLNKDYTDTLWFDSATDQYNWFYSMATSKGRRFEDYSYQRVNREYIRVGEKADNLYDYNYMMFRNTAYGNKWFFAFIDKVNYINDNTTELLYEIDVMQSWLFEAELGESYVVREHTGTDIAGSNILPEPFTVDNFICDNLIWDNDFRKQDEWFVAVAWSNNGDNS